MVRMVAANGSLLWDAVTAFAAAHEASPDRMRRAVCALNALVPPGFWLFVCLAGSDAPGAAVSFHPLDRPHRGERIPTENRKSKNRRMSDTTTV